MEIGYFRNNYKTQLGILEIRRPNEEKKRNSNTKKEGS